MAAIEQKIHEIKKINLLQQREQWINRIHPFTKLSLSVIYILFVISINKYRVDLMLALAIYPILTFTLAELSLADAIYRMRLILPIVMAVGIFNPFFDRTPILTIGSLAISGGVISMISLMLKGIYSVLAAYLLIATTSIEDICYALRMIRMPKLLVITILLINRYIYILGEEADRIMTAYQLRAPKQKGIHYKAWGSLIGQWLIRSMDRAQTVYEGMLLRGFHGEFVPNRKTAFRSRDLWYLLLWILVFWILRFTPAVNLLGTIFIR